MKAEDLEKAIKERNEKDPKTVGKFSTAIGVQKKKDKGVKIPAPEVTEKAKLKKVE